MNGQPVLYLDIDDTILTYTSGHPAAAPGAREFLLWAFDHAEVRWLTKWCPNGKMEESLARDLCHMVGVDLDAVRMVRGYDWQSSESKVNGIAWLEHIALGRPFVWIEDDSVGEFERRCLADHGFGHCYHRCNVTEDPYALARLHDRWRRHGLPV